MIVLPLTSGEDEFGGLHLVGLFGLGLIGSAIIEAMPGHARAGAFRTPLSWSYSEHWESDAEAILDGVSALSAGRPVRRLDLVWSAGRSGFGSPRDETEAELRSFEFTMKLCQRLAEVVAATETLFHFMSSAGGLFEGQTSVGREAEPKPQRHYGRLKETQERALSHLLPGSRKLIYRPSSVYGYRFGGRMGIVPTLIHNGLRNRPSEIFGHPDTCRDYVFVEDVGRFIARKLQEPAEQDELYLLASGKPTSIREMVRLVEKLLRRRLYLRFDPKAPNSMTNSYLASGLPSGWRPTSLEIGVRKTFYAILDRYVASGAA